MASLKGDRVVATQPSAGQAKKEPAPKASGTTTTPKAPASKPAPKKVEPKPREPKRNTTTGSKPAAKN